jgi:hypothetical protein
MAIKMDNKQIKDGLGNVFTIRSKDVSAALDGSLQRSMFFSTAYPVDYGANGIFQHCARSGVMLAGLPANAPIYSFRWSSATALALLWRLRLVAWSNTRYAGGVASFDVFAARNFTANDTAGTSANLGGENNQLRTIMASGAATILYSGTAALTPGTRTLDAAPLDSRTINCATVANTMFPGSPTSIFERLQGEHPLVLAQNEGLVVQASLPSDGAWKYSLTAEWAEVAQY